MKILVVYDSFFGNTEKIAHAVKDTFNTVENTDIVRVNDIKESQLTGVDLLIVGSPTRAFNMTKGISKFLKKIPAGSLKGVRAAGFDTRVSVEDTGSAVLRFFVRLFGYAAEPITTKLEKKGATKAVEPEGFIVTGSEGPLKKGELERAAVWTRQMI